MLDDVSQQPQAFARYWLHIGSRPLNMFSALLVGEPARLGLSCKFFYLTIIIFLPSSY
jgi:hypothetical protein